MWAKVISTGQFLDPAAETDESEKKRVSMELRWLPE